MSVEDLEDQAACGTRPAAVLAAVHRATRELLYVDEPDDVGTVLAALVVELGGCVVDGPRRTEQGIDLTVDGDLVRTATASDPEVLRVLRQHLPTVVGDARASYRLARLAHAADVDPLTGLSNRRAANRLVPRLRDGDTVAVLDLDRFKDVNDTLGHEAGDEVLAQFGRLLREHSRVADRYLRIGGEEFLGVFHRQQPDEALPALDRIRQEWSGGPERRSFSAGLAAVTADDGVAAWRLADERMYGAKRAGRDAIHTA